MHFILLIQKILSFIITKDTSFLNKDTLMLHRDFNRHDFFNILETQFLNILINLTTTLIKKSRKKYLCKILVLYCKS